MENKIAELQQQIEGKDKEIIDLKSQLKYKPMFEHMEHYENALDVLFKYSKGTLRLTSDFVNKFDEVEIRRVYDNLSVTPSEFLCHVFKERDDFFNSISISNDPINEDEEGPEIVFYGDLFDRKVVWHSPESTPEVGKNEKRTFWIAVNVTLRPCNGDPVIKQVVFPAQYLNMPLEYDDEGELLNDDCPVNTDGDHVEAIGWHTERDHEEFDNYHPAIDFNDDYVLLGWAEYEVPSFTGVNQ